MARARTSAAELARLLNSAKQPIYVLDEDQMLVFCNRACLDWVGCTADELQGRRCAYHSSPEVGGPEGVAAGLCPSPEALAGREMRGTVGCVLADGRLCRRRARFVPFDSDPEGPIGLVALVDPDDLPEPETPSVAPADTEAARLHERIRRYRRQAAARYRADRLVGDSPAIRRARAQMALAADTEASVLVVGPPGSGRQHVASGVHYGRRGEPPGTLVPLACSVLGAELIRSTVAALSGRRPSPERPGRSTLVLNDADQLPSEVQAELAAVFSGSSFPLRLIATARQRLTDLPPGGQYREDLAAVLSTIVIELPPLAQRRADLPMLAQVFLEDANAKGLKQVAGLSPEALDRLDQYPWPGNVDELAQMVARAHRRAEGVQITVADLPERIHLAADAAAHPRRPEETIELDVFLARIERELIRRAMARANGNKTRAAKLLGMTRPRLYRRLVQLGLAGPGES